MPKPIAPKAKEAYKNSTISTINWLDPSYSVYARNLAYPHGIAREISEIDANDSDFFRPISRKIRREIRAGVYPEGLITNDTVYIETPKHNGVTRTEPRVASKYQPNGDEYEILKRRFNEAKSVSKPAKKQQGGQLNMNEQELQQAFIQFLAQKTGAKTQQELEAAIQQLGEEGLKQAYAEFMQLIQQQQVQAAKFGAKINYIKKLRGQCPDGYDLQYYKSGGQLCKKCIKKQVMQEGGNVPQDPIDQFKCGRKIKKKKCEAGGTVDMDKCGAKMKKKKCENGGFIPFDKCGKKMKKKQEGGNLETSKPTKTNKTPFVVYDGKGKKKVTYVKDEATRDSLYANRYNDQEVQALKPGSYKNGKWTPDRSKSPYKRK